MGQETRGTEIKYLVIMIDENLNCNKHVNYITHKIRKYYNGMWSLYGSNYVWIQYKEQDNFMQHPF